MRVAAFPALSAVRLTRELRERGYTGAYTAVKRFVAAIRPAGRPRSTSPASWSPSPTRRAQPASSGWQRIVPEAFAAEKPESPSLPAVPFDALLKLERRVSHDRLVSILDGGRLVASHPILEGRRQYRSALDEILTEELTLRENRRVKTALLVARLTTIKTLAGFDFTFQPSLDRDRILALAELTFIDRSEVADLLGPPGTGKSHLATALAVEAVKAGRSVCSQRCPT